MQSPLRRALFAAAALVAGGVLPSGADTTGVVSGVPEQDLINQILACQTVERDAFTISRSQAQDVPLNPLAGDEVKAMMADAIERLEAIAAQIDVTEEDLLAGTHAAQARKAIQKARDLDGEARVDVTLGLRADYVSDAIEGAVKQKNLAILFLQGIRTTRRDEPQVEANPPAPTHAVEPDIGACKNFFKISRKDQAAGKGDYFKGKGKGKKPPKLKKYHYNYLTTAAAAVLPNYYFAFSGTSADAGYIYKSIGRPLFGPFEARFQVGAFDPNSNEDTGSACVEFDLEGSDPLEFVAVCGRRVDGGVQVFIQTHEGAAGNVFLSSTRIAQVLVDYSGTAFTVRAGIQDTPDLLLTPVGTVNFAQGETAFIAGLGASGLTKGTEIGLDEVYFTPK